VADKLGFAQFRDRSAQLARFAGHRRGRRSKGHIGILLDHEDRHTLRIDRPDDVEDLLDGQPEKGTSKARPCITISAAPSAPGRSPPSAAHRLRLLVENIRLKWRFPDSSN